LPASQYCIEEDNHLGRKAITHRIGEIEKDKRTDRLGNKEHDKPQIIESKTTTFAVK
jgi:hypothetical protein